MHLRLTGLKVRITVLNDMSTVGTGWTAKNCYSDLQSSQSQM
jgi:hypothetical protein